VKEGINPRGGGPRLLRYTTLGDQPSRPPPAGGGNSLRPGALFRQHTLQFVTDEYGDTAGGSSLENAVLPTVMWHC
jgi:hypothetical protein